LSSLLKQYLNIKKEHKDTILLFHIGDFYETFYDDAKIASKILNITLTSKPMGKGIRVPLAGIPIKAANSYIDKLIRAGQKVAICEQKDDTKTKKGLVKREVVEVITSGTLMRPSLLMDKDNNYISSVMKVGDKYALAFSDISTGEFRSGEVKDIFDELVRLSPKEIILPEGLELVLPDNTPVTYLEAYKFEYEYALNIIKDHFGIISIDSFGFPENSPGIIPAGALLSYLCENQKMALNHIKKISQFNPESTMILDAMTIKNLEIVERINGEKKDSLLYTIDKTITSIGGRLLKKWILYPLTDVGEIEERYYGVSELIFKRNILNDIREILENVYDIERITGRISTNRAIPRDILALKDSLVASKELKISINELDSSIFKKQRNEIGNMDSIIELIERAIVEDPPGKLTEGGIFKEGYNEELDRVRSIALHGKEWVVNYEKEQRKKTGIESLKVGYNSVFGYYIDVTKPNLGKVPEGYIKKQTLSNSERFITEELKKFESEILSSEEKQNEIESMLFKELLKQLQSSIVDFERIANAVGIIDIICSFSLLSIKNNYVRPKVSYNKIISIKNGRHPVVESLLPSGEFIPNETDLKPDERIIILTGPNMAGKSTYLRQIAQIILLAQMGSFVPADYANIGVIDRIFTRIGASDDLARGVSTFLAEMNETANILNNVTDKSLVLLDEIGRGTSTYDGLSIAWAVVEYLHSLPEFPLVLFATHYHELTELEEFYSEVVNYNVSVKETEKEVIFERRVKKGASDRSYGVEVARLAGLPKSVIKRAKELLEDLRKDERIAKGHPPKQRQLKLFDKNNILIDKINSINPDNLTPKEALKILYEIKEKLKNN
jgi:DNA mismatch repair protein MutS